MGPVNRCPGCGAAIEPPSLETREDGPCMMVVAVDPGTFWTHLRDAHPDVFARMVECRQGLNRHPEHYGMPRTVDGYLLTEGRDVADIFERRTE